jgi:hypothetical protein
MSTIATTYTVHLCKNGKEFKSIPNCVSPQPLLGDTIDDKWKICGVISSGDGELVVDVEEVP